MKTTHDGRRHTLVMERGEELFSTLTSFCETQHIQNAAFQAIGAVERVQIGYYDLKKREYFFQKESDTFEVASMSGNVALLNGKPFIHAHAVLSRCDQSHGCIGGHLKEAYVAVTLEVFLIALDSSFERSKDDAIGLHLLAV